MSKNIMLHKVPGGGNLIGESFAGSDCTGSDGDANRVLTTSELSKALGDEIIFADGQFLRETTDYTTSGDDITFLIKIWDSHKLDVKYLK